MRVVPEWFEKRRSTAMSIMAAGAALSGLALPALMAFCNRELGPAWSFRIIAFGFLGILSVSCMLLKERYPKMHAAQGSSRRPLNLDVL
ncbi:hypothetical protein BJV82DRAFT_632719, partial [Fennellomyces sp. T-0311]